MVADGGHALVVLDGADWHRSRSLEFPGDVTLPHLPARSPEFYPAETVFLILKASHFANQVCDTADAVREKVDVVWSDFTRDADRTRSLGTRPWAALTAGTSSISCSGRFRVTFLNWYDVNRWPIGLSQYQSSGRFGSDSNLPRMRQAVQAQGGFTGASQVSVCD